MSVWEGLILVYLKIGVLAAGIFAAVALACWLVTRRHKTKE